MLPSGTPWKHAFWGFRGFKMTTLTSCSIQYSIQSYTLSGIFIIFYPLKTKENERFSESTRGFQKQKQKTIFFQLIWTYFNFICLLYKKNFFSNSMEWISLFTWLTTNLFDKTYKMKSSFWPIFMSDGKISDRISQLLGPILEG